MSHDLVSQLGGFDMRVGHYGSLATPWIGRVLLTVEYDSWTRKFMTKMVNHHHGTAVMVAGVDTALFHRYVFGQATAALFVEGRTKLSHGSAPVPTALVTYGEADTMILRRADIKGHFVWLDGAKRTGERMLA